LNKERKKITNQRCSGKKNNDQSMGEKPTKNLEQAGKTKINPLQSNKEEENKHNSRNNPEAGQEKTNTQIT
jgi:hypothetical protein